MDLIYFMLYQILITNHMLGGENLLNRLNIILLSEISPQNNSIIFRFF